MIESQDKRFWLVIILVVLFSYIQELAGKEVLSKDLNVNMFNKKYIYTINLNGITQKRSISAYQRYWLKEAYNYGNTQYASDGMNFGLTLAMIIGQESSFGKKLLRDDELSFRSAIQNSSIGLAQFHIPSARDVIRWYSLDKYKEMSDYDLGVKLYSDPRFSMMLTALKLKFHYEQALKRGYSNPWQKSLSRHNGGWYNARYIADCLDEKLLIRAVIKQGYK